MTRRKISRFARLLVPAVFAAAAMAAGPSSWVFASPDDAPERPAASAEPLMEQTYKNIQVLKGLPASQMGPMMSYIAATLGMTCTECHVVVGDQVAYEKDDREHKRDARRMITMTMEINKQYFKGRTQVGCMTCHQGHEHPVSTPILPLAAPETEAPPTGPRPSAADVLAKYTQAVGGAEALAGVKTRVAKGTIAVGGAPALSLVLRFAAPDRCTWTVGAPPATVVGTLNGASGWVQSAHEDRAMDAAELSRARSLAASLDPQALTRDPSLKLGFGGFERVGAREAVVLRGRLADRRRLRLFFDRESGLLVRRIVTTETPIGLDPEQTDYEDYRDVAGVKVPFTIRTSSLDAGGSSVRTFTEVKHGEKIDDAAFALPVPK